MKEQWNSGSVEKRGLRAMDSNAPISNAPFSTASKAVTVRQALQKGTEFLSQMGVESACLDAELLLSKALGRTKERLYLDYEMALETAVKDLYFSLLQRRARREPLAYITGEREFWSLRFHVTPEVLVPRPETELLVEVTLELAKRLEKIHPIKILDLGTGSGAIAVSLAKELDDIEVWATDLSAPALEVAQSNALRHGVSEKIHFIEGDMFCPVKGQHGFFAMVVSNPPYVRQSELQNLAQIAT
ncbi:MAG: peptide chain release factor N(5)-glutamine methyltransferase [Deltaproteobacteria bacterium]|nr:peptide chain release factor N(5)-glutamine methyltransferase [Deltaproteobacteria bacterium]